MSLRWRLILSHTFVVVLCLTIAAVAVTALLQGFRDRFAMARLDDMTIPIYVQARALAQRQASVDEVWAHLEEQAQATGVYIYLADDQRNIIRQASPSESTEMRLDKLPRQALPQALSEPYHGVYRAPSRQTFFFVTYPLATLFGSHTPSVPEVLVLAIPRQGALSLLVGLARPFWWAGLIAFAVSIVIAFSLARSVYRPIQRVTDAADEIARGQYDQEIPLAGPKEMKELALAFNDMAKQVNHSQQRLREFLADVSHELRTPLTSIRGFAQAMVDGTARDNEARSRAAEIIEDESKRMIRLVDELLELSKIESGQIQMQREPVDVTALLGHCQEIFALRAEEKGLELRANLEPLPPVVGDIDRLEQVLSNLLDNAVKHTPAGGKVSISAGARTDFVEITVADTGPGVSPDELPHIFHRFYRANAVGIKTGAGLGLAIAREIARAHGGDIEVRSALGGGAEFIVRLPTSLSA